MTSMSLRRRLIITLLSLSLATWLLSVTVTAIYAQQMINQQIDRQLDHYMDMAQYTLQAVLRNGEVKKYFWKNTKTLSSASHVTRLEGFGSRGLEQATNLWFSQNQVLVGENAPKFPAPTVPGTRVVRLGQGSDSPEWRILYRYDPDQSLWLAVGVNMDRAESIGAVTFWRVIMPLVIILPVTTAILLLGLNRGLRPLHMLAEKISSRHLLALEPIDMADVPTEMRPVVNSLNDLLDRLQRALASEQRFTANAAHELQTPLAAIKAEVQRCQRQVEDNTTRDMLERISTRVGRATDTVKQLLTLARLDPDQEFDREPIDLGELVVDVIAELGVLAVDRHIDIVVSAGDDGASIEGRARIQGNREWLKILLRNLLLNALNYSPAPGEVEVQLVENDHSLSLLIANDCDPITETDFNRLPDRFYRLPGSNPQGVGLGLSIAKRIAQLHAAELHLARWKSLRGFQVEVRFSRVF